MRKINLRMGGLVMGIIVIFLVVIRKCSFHQLPKEKITTPKIEIQHKYDNNQYQLTIKNLLECPNRLFLSCTDKDVNELISGSSPLVLDGKADTTIIVADKGNLKDKINIKFKWGNPKLSIQSTKIESLPFPEDKSYELLQGNNSNPTHNHDASRYAFDFTMKIGDTVTSTQNGYVVAVIDGYKGWGYSDKWKSYGNQVMIYDTLSHLFTTYGHLKQYGSLVKLGQFVKVGEPIALSGKTGQVPEEHLHYNVFRADNGKSGLISFRLDSIGNYKVKELERNQSLKN